MSLPEAAAMQRPLEPLSLLAAYNQWMNVRLYDAAATLPHEELIADRGAFFKSILGTLNHLAVADTIWLKRFALHPTAPTVLAQLQDTPLLAALDAMPYADLHALRQRRQWLDDIIVAWVEALKPGDLDSVLEYRNTRGTAFRRPLGSLAMHFFNHQTHHRGRITTLLSQAGVDVGVTDLVALIPAFD